MMGCSVSGRLSHRHIQSQIRREIGNGFPWINLTTRGKLWPVVQVWARLDEYFRTYGFQAHGRIF